MTIQENSTKHYPGFRGGAKRPTTEFRYIKVPGGRKHIPDETGMSTFVKKKYNVTFMLDSRKKKQAVWAKDDAEAIAMIKDLYPRAERPFKKNPRQQIETLQNHLIAIRDLEHELRQYGDQDGLIQKDIEFHRKRYGKLKNLKKNPRGAGIPIDQVQLDLMIEAHKSDKVFADSAKERKAADRLVRADLMLVVSKANDVYNLTVRGKKLLIEYLKEQEKYA